MGRSWPRRSRRIGPRGTPRSRDLSFASKGNCQRKSPSSLKRMCRQKVMPNRQKVKTSRQKMKTNRKKLKPNRREVKPNRKKRNPPRKSWRQVSVLIRSYCGTRPRGRAAGSLTLELSLMVRTAPIPASAAISKSPRRICLAGTRTASSKTRARFRTARSPGITHATRAPTTTATGSSSLTSSATRRYSSCRAW